MNFGPAQALRASDVAFVGTVGALVPGDPRGTTARAAVARSYRGDLAGLTLVEDVKSPCGQLDLAAGQRWLFFGLDRGSPGPVLVSACACAGARRLGPDVAAPAVLGAGVAPRAMTVGPVPASAPLDDAPGSGWVVVGLGLALVGGVAGYVLRPRPR